MNGGRVDTCLAATFFFTLRVAAYFDDVASKPSTQFLLTTTQLRSSEL